MRYKDYSKRGVFTPLRHSVSKKLGKFVGERYIEYYQTCKEIKQVLKKLGITKPTEYLKRHKEDESLPPYYTLIREYKKKRGYKTLFPDRMARGFTNKTKKNKKIKRLNYVRYEIGVLK